MILKFNLNNKDISIETDPAVRLSTLLRESFNMLNTKENCYNGHCGACTVLLNNNPVPSCIIPVFTVEGKNVVTLEGFQERDEFEIIDKSLKNAGADICSYCRQGRILVIYSLLLKNMELSDKQIYKALSGNRCECTDFKSLKKGIKLALLTYNRKKRAKHR